MKRFLVIWFLCVLFVIACAACSTEAWERAEAQKYDAAARAASAPYAGEVSVINARKDATLQELSQLSLLSKEERLFDAQLARNEFATIILEFEALELSIQDETEAARRVTDELEKATEDAGLIGHNTSAAANNSYWSLLAFIPFGAVLFGLTVFCVVMFIRLERRR